MDIIEGIFTEEMFRAMGEDKMVNVLTGFKPLLRSSTALEMHKYMTNPNADKNLVSIIDRVLGDGIVSYVYINKIRTDRLNANVLNYDILGVEEAYRNGMFCGMPVKEGVETITHVVNNRMMLKSQDMTPSRTEWEAFKDCMLVNLNGDREAYNRFLVNSTRIYNTKAKPISLGVGGIISRMDSLEMGLKGIRYLEYLEKQGITGAGGITF